MPRSSSPPSTHQLKISPSHYDTQLRHWPPPPPVPFIRLRGYWLQKAGFAVGALVKVQVADGCITIVPVDR